MKLSLRSYSALVFLIFLVLPVCIFAVLSLDGLYFERAVLELEDTPSVVEPRVKREENLPLGSPPKAVALLVHGLNLRADKMEVLAGLFRELGAVTFTLSLSGHEPGEASSWQSAGRQAWASEFYQAYLLAARAAADAGGIPLFYAGFSLGGLLPLDVAEQAWVPEVQFDRMALLAPAISVRAYTHLVRFYRVLGPNGEVKSLSHPDYRAQEATGNRAYAATIAMQARVEHNCQRPLDVPTLVWIDEDDEIVDPAGIESWIRGCGLKNWKLHRFRRAQIGEGSTHHLLFDPFTMGEETWQAWIEAFRTHFR